MYITSSLHTFLTFIYFILFFYFFYIYFFIDDNYHNHERYSLFYKRLSLWDNVLH